MTGNLGCVGRAGSLSGFAAFVFFTTVISFGFVLAFCSGGGGRAAGSSVRVGLAAVCVAAAGIAGSAGPGAYHCFAASRNDCGVSAASLGRFVGDSEIMPPVDSAGLSCDDADVDTSPSADNCGTGATEAGGAAAT